MVDEAEIAIIRPLRPGFRTVLQGDAPPFPAALLAEVDAIWTREKAARGERLFDGPSLSLAAATPDEIVLRPCSYRHFLAARRRPELRAALGVRPTGVIGLVQCMDGLLLGRRAAHLAAAPGRWEPAPAGTLDRPDPLAVLADELVEELGLPPETTAAPQPLAIVEDVAHGVIDIVFTVACRLDAAAVRRAQAGAAHADEYDALAILADSEIGGFLKREAGTIRPVLPAMLRTAGYTVE